MKTKTTQSELIPLFGVAFLLLLSTQLFDELNPTLLGVIVFIYVVVNTIFSAILGILTVGRFIEHCLIAAIVWIVVSSLI